MLFGQLHLVMKRPGVAGAFLKKKALSADLLRILKRSHAYTIKDSKHVIVNFKKEANLLYILGKRQTVCQFKERDKLVVNSKTESIHLYWVILEN